MIDFISIYYKEILLLGSFFVELVFFLIALFSKKKVPNGAIAQIFSVLPEVIVDVEDRIGKGHGDLKKSLVLDVCLKMYKSLTGVEISLGSKIADTIDKAIEDILSAPQKKGK